MQWQTFLVAKKKNSDKTLSQSEDAMALRSALELLESVKVHDCKTVPCFKVGPDPKV